MLEKRKGPGQKPQSITVKFTRYKDRYHVFRNKKLLKGSCICYRKPYFETDRKLKKAREQHGSANVWTLDGEDV